MDAEKRRRKKVLKVIVMDCLMAVAMVGLSFLLLAIVSGWRLNSKLSLEQNGLLKIESTPNEALVKIEPVGGVGKKYTLKTTASEMLPGGKYRVNISKNGYDSWQKTVVVEPGWLTDLNYPRLFRQNNKTEQLKQIKNAELISLSPDKTTALYLEELSGDLRRFDLKTRQISREKIKIPAGVNLAKAEILQSMWDGAKERVLLQLNSGQHKKWLLLNLQDGKKSVDLTDRLTAVDELNFVGKTEQLVTLNYGNLAVIDLANQSSSPKILANRVSAWSSLDKKIIYASTPNQKGECKVNWLNGVKTKPQLIAKVKCTGSVKLGLTQFGDENLVFVASGRDLQIYGVPNFAIYELGSNQIKKKAHFVLKQEVKNQAKISAKKRFIAMQDGERMTVFDAGLMRSYQYTADLDAKWLDDYLLYKSDKGKLKVWDFDGSNRRVIKIDKSKNWTDAWIWEGEDCLHGIDESVQSLEFSCRKIN